MILLSRIYNNIDRTHTINKHNHDIKIHIDTIINKHIDIQIFNSKNMNCNVYIHINNHLYNGRAKDIGARCATC